MNFDLPEPLKTLVTIAGFAGYLAAFWVFFRGYRAKNTIDLLESNNDALLEQNKIIKAENVELTAKLHNMQGQLDVLKDMVTGASAVKALAEQMAQSFSESHRDHAKIVTVLETIGTHFARPAGPAEKPRGRRSVGS